MRETSFSNGPKGTLSRAPVERAKNCGSMSSAGEFFESEPVSMIDEGRIEEYKTWRFNEHDVRGITVRHDLHVLSVFFQYAMNTSNFESARTSSGRIPWLIISRPRS